MDTIYNDSRYSSENILNCGFLGEFQKVKSDRLDSMTSHKN